MSARRLGVRAVAGSVTIGQRWEHKKTKQQAVVYQVHRAERRVEAYRDGSVPSAPHSRFYLSFAELSRHYKLNDSEAA